MENQIHLANASLMLGRIVKYLSDGTKEPIQLGSADAVMLEVVQMVNSGWEIISASGTDYVLKYDLAKQGQRIRINKDF